MLFAEAWHQTCLTRAALYHIYFELGVGVQGPFWLIFHVRLSTGVKPSNLPLTTQTLTEMLEYDCAKSSQHSQFRNQALQLLSLHLRAIFLVFSVRSVWWFIFFFWSFQSSSRPGCGLLFCAMHLPFLSAFGLACVSQMSETSGLGHLFALTEILPGKNVHSIATGADRVHVAVFPRSLHPRWVDLLHPCELSRRSSFVADIISCLLIQNFSEDIMLACYHSSGFRIKAVSSGQVLIFLPMPHPPWCSALSEGSGEWLLRFLRHPCLFTFEVHLLC